MRLLIGGSSSKLFHLQEFASSLAKFDIECRVVFDADVYDGFPSRRIGNWFQTRSKFNKLINEFKPDAIFIDRHRHFGLAAAKTGKPLLVHLRGDHWKEMEMAKQTLYRSLPRKIAIVQWEKIAEKCFQDASMIFPICRYLADIVKARYPEKRVSTLYQGIDPDKWFHSSGMSLKHPCVGLLQSANIWDKTREMLTLESILKKMPGVTFYWVGDGPYRDYVLSSLKKYDNFKWLGALPYPDKVREYLSEIDVYALVSGLDMSPLTVLESQLMEKPVIATSVGGVPELIKNNVTGLLVEKSNPDDLYEKITILLNDEQKRKEFGRSGRAFVKENFSWERVCSDFATTLKQNVG
ncbi:glycosyltransferase family 4 protein [Candidatus Nitrosotenuis cloacae]|uniref:glycosyltransferase family 4 protein n=1 Tax=Candidatus Nitrosotenuis cloacae TaxID=1603555 RepID=UPI00227E38AB|nr:glycosyltransferase family 4 protein [Candidatus Nitrosotenuis cloacae]